MHLKYHTESVEHKNCAHIQLNKKNNHLIFKFYLLSTYNAASTVVIIKTNTS